MAHEQIQLLTRTLELKRKSKVQKKLLQEVYVIVDEYNTFVVSMDKRLDDIVLRLEKLTEDEY